MLVALLAAGSLTAQQGDPALLTPQRIFASAEFRAEVFGPARWLDGATYTTLEPATGGPGRDIVRYDAATGARQVMVAAAQLSPPGAPGPIETTDFALRVGDEAQVEVELYDAEGRELLAPVGVHWSVDDPAVATVSAFLIASAPMLDDGLAVDLHAVAPGDTMLSVTVPGLEDAASVSVGE